MKVLSTIVLAGAVAASSSTAEGALIVTTTTDAAVLANTLVAGSGDITITGQSLIGTSTQQGTFTGGLSAGIGIQSGVILTSGDANLAPGPNNSGGAGASLGTAGDAQLTEFSGVDTFDANVLNVSFTSTTGDLFFQYVFASEEYNEFVGSSFNDVFGFFIDDVNIALVPGTTDPVTINNVNCGNPFGTGDTNCDQFVNNEAATFDLQYDGFTRVFTASILGLVAGQEYDLALKIADSGDRVLDSAVFLRGGSFQGTNPTNPVVPEPATLTLVGLGLVGLVARRRKL